MEKFIDCNYCDGDGYVMEELTGNVEPWTQREVELDCIKCNRSGKVLSSDYLEWIDELIDAMQTRMRHISDMIMLSKKGMLDELAAKYTYRLDTCARGLGRLQQYRKKLVNLP